MAYAARRLCLAAGLLVFFCFATTSAHPPHPGGAKQASRDGAPWRRLGVAGDDSSEATLEDWASGFGQRLTVIQRRQGPVQHDVVEASSKLVTVTQQLRPKGAEATPGAVKLETSTARLVRKRVHEELPVAANETVQPIIQMIELAGNLTTTTSTTPEPITQSTSTSSTTTSLASKPLWRVRLEHTQNMRRQQAETVTSTPQVEPSSVVSSSSVASSRSTPLPVVRAPLTTLRIPPVSVASTRTTLVVATTKLVDVEEENDVKNAVVANEATSTTASTTTTTKAPSTTTTKPPSTTTKAPSTTKKAAPPTPIMSSLEDILQRLVPTRDDSFGHNPFLAPPLVTNPAGTYYTPASPSTDEVNEIVSITNLRPVGVAKVNPSVAAVGQNSSAVPGTNRTNGWTDPNEAQTTTSIYIVGVVAIIPLAGVVLWVVRVHLHKRRERLNESETSSETGFRKRLPPVALTPSKHARLFYGASDKEDLVPVSGVGMNNGKASPPSPWEFTRSRLRLQTLIGEGNFGQVWKAEAEDICGCQGTLLVAVKTVKDGAAAKEKQELLREMRIMQQLGPHPNVVALLGCCTEQEPFLLIMEYVMYGRLLTFLREHRTQQTYYNYSTDSEALTSRDLTTFAYCVAKGMEYIYSKGVVHRDLAARNVLVDHNKLCKVADFGLSRSVRDTAGEMYEQRVKGALPIRWMAPESLIQSVFTQKSDVWSFGILVWEILTLGSTPYPGMEAREVMRRVKDGHRLERPSHCRPEFYRLMSRCWHSDPQRRPDFGELKAELARLLDDADGYIDLDNFQESIYVPLESPSDESEKV